MQVQFEGYSRQNRTIEFDEEDLAILYDILREVFATHVEFGCYDRSRYVSPVNQKILDLCDKYGVDGDYTKDRVSFYKAILEAK
jgi:hypothetical protein